MPIIQEGEAAPKTSSDKNKSKLCTNVKTKHGSESHD